MRIGRIYHGEHGGTEAEYLFLRVCVVNLFLASVLFIAGCSSAPPKSTVDGETVQYAASARAAYERGAYPQAVRFYELALNRARANDDGPEIARNGYNLAACQLALGLTTEARVTLQEALAEFGRARMDSQPALLLDAKAAQAAGQVQESRRVLDLAYGACKTDAQRVQVWLVRGELCADAGDGAGAGAALGEAEKIEGDALVAARLSLAGRVGMLENKAAAAAQNFDAAAAAWQRDGQTRDMAGALGRAGEAYLLAGDARAAADRLYRAARSLYAQGDAVGALQRVQRGLEANAQAEDAELQGLLTGLFESIKQDVEQMKIQATANGRE